MLNNEQIGLAIVKSDMKTVQINCLIRLVTLIYSACERRQALPAMTVMS